MYRCSLGSYCGGGHGPVYALAPVPLAPGVPTVEASEIPFVSDGILNSTQWSKTPSGFKAFGTSGSSIISASDCVPSGMPEKISAGFIERSPSQVNFEGMRPSCSNSGLVIDIVLAIDELVEGIITDSFSAFRESIAYTATKISPIKSIPWRRNAVLIPSEIGSVSSDSRGSAYPCQI